MDDGDDVKLIPAWNPPLSTYRLTGACQVLSERALSPPSPPDLSTISVFREEMWRQFRGLPAKGCIVNHLDREYLVVPDVFWPHRDSWPLLSLLEVQAGDRVLDVGTGCGVIAITAALAGASLVVGIDVSATAVMCAGRNATRHGVENIVRAVHGSLSSINWTGSQVDLITANLPFSEGHAGDQVERTMLDPGLESWRSLFAVAPTLLRPGGRLLIAQANFGAIAAVLEMAADAGFRSLRGAEEATEQDPRVFWALEMCL